MTSFSLLFYLHCWCNRDNAITRIRSAVGSNFFWIGEKHGLFWEKKKKHAVLEVGELSGITWCSVSQGHLARMHLFFKKRMGKFQRESDFITVKITKTNLELWIYIYTFCKVTLHWLQLIHTLLRVCSIDFNADYVCPLAEKKMLSAKLKMQCGCFKKDRMNWNSLFLSLKIFKWFGQPRVASGCS